MSGVFGYLTAQAEADVAGVLTRQAERMSYREWYDCDSWIDAAHGVGLGRISIGILNGETQPIVSRDGRVILFLTGEFFDWSGAPGDERLRRDSAHSDAEFALQLYEAYGPHFAKYAAGAFVAAVYDRQRRVLRLTNDRFGLYPMYYSHQTDRLAFAPEVKGVLQAPGVRRDLDDVALAQYMRFQQVLGTRTFFKDVRLLPNASVLTFDLNSGALRIEPYWTFDEVPAKRTAISFGEAVEETARLIQQSVARRLQGDHRVGLFLSGGLDSRIILAACLRNGAHPVTLTYGLRDSRDAHYAARLARRSRTPHRFFEFADGRWVIDCVDFHLALTEGFHSWVHMHGIQALALARELFDINLTGLGGDVTLGGYSVEPLLRKAPDRLTQLIHLFWTYNQLYNWPGITEAEEHTLYTPAAHARLRGLAFESFRQESQPYQKYDRDCCIDYFSLIQSDLRHYGHFVTFGRSHCDVRHPYYDYDLLDFALSLPPEFREKRRLAIGVLSRLAPALARVPMDRDDTLPSDNDALRNLHALMVKVRRRFNRHVYPLFRERFSLHSDYEGWLRGDLREWAESILFDRRTLERGLFNPHFIRSVWARHQAGHEPWTLGKIAPIMTYEMMLRKFVDGSPARTIAAPTKMPASLQLTFERLVHVR